MHYFNELNDTIAWKNDEVIIFGKLIKMTRKVAWYATSNIDYTYSNISKKALPFTPTLLSLKQIIEQRLSFLASTALYIYPLYKIIVS